MQQRVYSIVSRILNVPLRSIDDSSSPDSLKTWDSLHHLQIVLALEEEFGVQFFVVEIGALQNVGTIIAILQERTGADGHSDA